MRQKQGIDPHTKRGSASLTGRNPRYGVGVDKLGLVCYIVRVH